MLAGAQAQQCVLVVVRVRRRDVDDVDAGVGREGGVRAVGRRGGGAHVGEEGARAVRGGGGGRGRDGVG